MVIILCLINHSLLLIFYAFIIGLQGTDNCINLLFSYVIVCDKALDWLLAWHDEDNYFARFEKLTQLLGIHSRISELEKNHICFDLFAKLDPRQIVQSTPKQFSHLMVFMQVGNHFVETNQTNCSHLAWFPQHSPQNFPAKIELLDEGVTANNHRSHGSTEPLT